MDNETQTYTTPEVDETTKGERLDKFLASSIPEISRSQIQRLI